MVSRRLYLLAALALLLAPGVALADAIIDFSLVVPTSGKISYAGGANPLVGSHIDVDFLTGLSTPAHASGKVNLIGGFLNFTTGLVTGTDASHWFFGGGGTITISAKCADLNGDGKCDAGDPSGVLLTGTWSAAQVIALGSVFKVAGGTFTDSTSLALLHFFGLSKSAGLAGTLNLSFDARRLPPKGFRSSKVLSGDVVNNIPVPEPATLALLGTGLISIAVLRRRLRNSRFFSKPVR